MSLTLVNSVHEVTPAVRVQCLHHSLITYCCVDFSKRNFQWFMADVSSTHTHFGGMFFDMQWIVFYWSSCSRVLEFITVPFWYFSSIQNYDKHYSSTGGFETNAFFKAVGDFCSIFTLSLIIGAAMGCITALMTKFTRIRDFPLLESALFVLMSYSTFLIAEVTELTGSARTPIRWRLDMYRFFRSQESFRCYSAAFAKHITRTTICQTIRAYGPSRYSSCLTFYRKISFSHTSACRCSPFPNTTSTCGSFRWDS